jgi:predicted cobalt transporter CbtA
MVGDIPRPLFIKLNQVMWRTESKLALVAIALIVLGGIYGMSNKVTIERQMPSCTHGEWKLIVTIMYCSILQ